MIIDYKEIQKKVEEQTRKLGFVLFKEDEFSTIYKNDKGWKIILEGERYIRPAFDLSIVSDKSSEGFSLWILMKVFSEEHEESELVPSLKNQLMFLSDNFESLFVEKPWFIEKYNEINAEWEG